MLDQAVSLRRSVAEQIEEGVRLRRALGEQADLLIQIARELVTSFQQGGKLVLMGNGGSAADAQHIAAEFVGRFLKDREPLPSIALSTNTSALTAIANDYGYDQVFQRQVRAFVRERDVVIGISTSGRSPNVLAGLGEAKRRGAVTVAFTGVGGDMEGAADYVLKLPSTETPRIQEAHITAGHILCYLVEALLGNDGD